MFIHIVHVHVHVKLNFRGKKLGCLVYMYVHVHVSILVYDPTCCSIHYAFTCTCTYLLCLLFTGPNSSDTTDDTDSHDESHPALGASETCKQNGLAEDHQSQSVTPNLLSASSDSSSHLSGSEASGGLEYSSAIEDATEPDIGHKGASVIMNSVTSTADNRVPENGVSFSKFNSDEKSHHNSSNTDRISLPPQQYSSSVQRKLRTPWSTKKFDSDISTAPLSSETSDMDTSGHEKVCSDGGSTSDLTSMSRDSRSDVSCEVFPSSLQPHSASVSVGTRPSSAESYGLKRKTLSQNYKKAVAVTASPPVSKRPLKASLSTPLKTDECASSTALTDCKNSKAAPKPKPPIAAKPAKPEMRPKQPSLASTSRSASNSPPHQRKQLYSYREADTIDFVSELSKATVSALSKSEQKVPLIGISKTQRHGIRKCSSESNVLSRDKGANSPTFVPRKLANVREESEDKDSDTEKVNSTRPTRLSPTPRPQLLPTKPKSLVTGMSPTPPPKPRTSPKSPPVQHKVSTNDDAASPASETASSLPSSPLVHKRKPALTHKPTLPLKRPGLFRQSASAGALTTPSSKDRGSTASDRKHSISGERESTPPQKPHTKRRPYGREVSVPTRINQFQSVSSILTPSVSPTPPRLPPRSPILQKRDDELVRSSGSLSVQPTSHTATSSSSQEEAPPPVPFRKGERQSMLCEGSSPLSAAGPSPSTESGRQTPPIFKRIKPSQLEGTPPAGKKPKTSPRRPPPNPPHSPSPPPVPMRTKTIGQSSIAESHTVDPASPKRHSLFSPAMSKARSQAYNNKSKQNKELEKLYRQSLQCADDSAEVQRKFYAEQSNASTTARPRRHHTHYELTFLDSTMPPQLLKHASEPNSIVSPVSSDNVPPPLPSQPIPKKKDRQQTLLKRGPIQARDSISPPSQKSDDGTKSDTSSEWSVWSHTPPKNRIYDVISDVSANKAQKPNSSHILKKQTHNESKGSASSSNPVTRPESPFRRETKSFSSLMVRRSNSDRFKKNKLVPPIPIGRARQIVHRTPSVDKLDDRMERSVRLSACQAEVESSSDDEEEETVVSPIQQGKLVRHMYVHVPHW